MRASRAAAARRVIRARGGVAFLSVTVVVIGVLAFIHRGVAVAQVDLNDGGVWVTNAHDQLVGHLNYPSRTLDGGLLAPSASYDVSQHSNDVVLHEDSGKAVATISPSSLALSAPIALGGRFLAEQGGSNTAIFDPGSGRLWAFPTTQLAGFTIQAPPIATKLKGDLLAVDTDGDVLVLAPDGTVTKFTPAAEAWTSSRAGRISGYTPGAANQLTTVGDHLVVLDSKQETVRTTAGSSSVGAGAVLQLPGPLTDSVVVAVPDALLSVPLGGGDPRRRTVGDTGRPAAPAALDGCVYSAWAISGQYLRDCAGTSQDDARHVDLLAAAGTLTFRVNRDVIVLNDVTNGNVFLVNANMRLVDNWNDIKAQLQDQKKKDDSSQHPIATNAPPVRTKQNHPPVAREDSFGVRPGRSTTLPVLENDTDPDGDVLVADLPARNPSLGRLTQADGGRALRIDVPVAATGSASFTYTAEDGRGGKDQASVGVSVHPFSENAAPAETKVATLELEQRATVSYDALQDWIDPDGDAIYLKSVVGGPGLDVKVRADGLLTVHDLGTTAVGRKSVTVVVSDGQADGTGKVILDLKSRTNLPPEANADHVTVLRNRSVVVNPLDNDTDPGDNPISLTKVDRGRANTEIVPDYATGKFTFTSSVVGTQYINYSISDGPSVASSIVRVDVVDPKGTASPVAENDVALLPAAQSVTIYPLTNDSDPNNGVLVLQSVAVNGQSGLDVAIIDYSMLRITATRGLVGPASFSYTITNGTGSATAQVIVVPLPPVSTAQPPVLQDDAATVRAGDIVTVPVLDNDQSPSGSALRVDQRLRVDGKSLGTAFVSQDKVRLLAGPVAGQMRVVYTVFDSYHNYTSAVVVFTVTAPGKNSPPAPAPLVARVTAGKSVSIPVPTDGIDVDGDSISLTGLGSLPGKGAVEQQGNTLVYTANLNAAGTDHFTYRVVDPYGASSVGEVDVGIAAPSQIDQSPIALADNVIARTGRQLAIPVLTNDIDPDGDSLAIVADSVRPVDSTTTTPTTVVAGHVDLTTPAAPATLRYYYDVTDGRGGRSRGVLTVTVQTNAPLLPPVALDDTVTPAQVNGKPTVTIDVLANDSDPDGNFRKLDVTSAAPGVTVAPGGQLTVTMQPKRQIILYTDTDQDHLTGDAVVIVPSSTDDPPRLLNETPVQVKAGSSVELPLSQYVVVRPGHTARITFGAKVKSGGGSSGKLVKDAQTLEFNATPTYSGATSITFEVTDGKTAEDPSGLKAVLSIPIEVLPPNGRQPVFQPAVVTVAAGEPATRVDLRQMARDPDSGDNAKLSFTIQSVPHGISASLSGTTLSVSAPADTQPGSSFLLPASVTDGTTKPVAAQLPIHIVASTRPLISIRAADIADADAGKPSTIDIAGYVTNPFADEGKPISIVGHPSTYNGDGTVTASGTTLTITPKLGFHGQMTVTYTVQDATRTVSRYVDGSVAVTVRDVPDSPTNVDATTGESKTADVTWTAPANNGAEISGYTLFWQPRSVGSSGAGTPGSKPCGQVTECTVTTLTNDVQYTFTVVATNEVGNSKPSAPSRAVRPDIRPDPPAQPTVKFGDTEMTVAWVAPHTAGSAVTSYSVQVSGGSVQQSEIDNITPTRYVWQHLVNGTSYRFRVQAHSKAEEPSDWSPWSAADFPAGKPGPITRPTVENNANDNPPPSITINWAAPDPNGDPTMTYQVLEVDESTPFWTGTDLSTLRSYDTTSDQDKTFEVRAENKAGFGPWSPASEPVRVFQAPGPVQNLTVTPTGQDNTVQVTFGAAAGNGAQSQEIAYEWSANGQTGELPSGGGTIQNGTAFPNGQDVRIDVWARSTVRSQTVDGDHSTQTVNAYGPPGVPAVSATGSVNNVNLCWDGTNVGNGRAVDQVEIQTSDGGGQIVGVSGCTAQGNGRNQTKAIQARAHTAAGGWGPYSDTRSASTWGNKTYTLSVTGTPCRVHPGCRYLQVTVSAFDPGSTAYCYAGGVGEPDWSATFGTDGNGNGGPRGDRVLNDTPSARFSPGTYVAGTDAGGITCVQR